MFVSPFPQEYCHIVDFDFDESGDVVVVSRMNLYAMCKSKGDERCMPCQVCVLYLV
jgi:hypothetical protein